MKDSEFAKLYEQTKTIRLQLINNDKTLDQYFNAHPNVGVMNPLDLKVTNIKYCQSYSFSFSRKEDYLEEQHQSYQVKQQYPFRREEVRQSKKCENTYLKQEVCAIYLQFTSFLSNNNITLKRKLKNGRRFSILKSFFLNKKLIICTIKLKFSKRQRFR